MRPADLHLSNCLCPAAAARYYRKALEALEAMREGAADKRDFAPAFNAALNGLADDFEAHPEHGAWW